VLLRWSAGGQPYQAEGLACPRRGRRGTCRKPGGEGPPNFLDNSLLSLAFSRLIMCLPIPIPIQEGLGDLATAGLIVGAALHERLPHSHQIHAPSALCQARCGGLELTMQG
jgi:hypothetical protein